MNDLEPSELERRLLEAGRGETLPPELRAQMASALAGVAPGAAARTAVSWGFGKLLLPVALVGLSGLAWYATQHARRPQPLLPPLLQPMAAEVAAPTRHEQALTVEPPVAAPAVVLPPSAADAPDALGVEIALLDRARTALHDRDAARSLSILSDYERHFARGVLRPEADALQIEALLQRGSAAKARQLAQRFIADNPAHPLSDRVQRLLANAP